MLEAGLERPPDVQARMPAVARPHHPWRHQLIEQAAIGGAAQPWHGPARLAELVHERGGHLAGLAGPQPRGAGVLGAGGKELGQAYMGGEQRRDGGARARERGGEGRRGGLERHQPARIVRHPLIAAPGRRARRAARSAPAAAGDRAGSPARSGGPAP